MAHSKNWVKVNRSIFNNYLWQASEPFDCRSAWIDLILLANHDDGYFRTSRGVTIKIPRGSHFTSIRILAERWHWSVGKVKRYLDTLTETQMITQNGTQSGTLLNLVNYDDYQGQRNTDRYADDNTDEYTDDNTNGIADGIRTRRIEEEQENEEEREEDFTPPHHEEVYIMTDEEIAEWYEQNGGNPYLGNDRRQLDVPEDPPQSRVEQLRNLLHGIGAVPGGGSATGDSERYT